MQLRYRRRHLGPAVLRARADVAPQLLELPLRLLHRDVQLKLVYMDSVS